MEEYTDLELMGEGAYGQVYKAKNKDGEPCVLKFNDISNMQTLKTISSIREYDILTRCRSSPFCINLRKVIYSKNKDPTDLSPGETPIETPTEVNIVSENKASEDTHVANAKAHRKAKELRKS